LYLNSGSVSVSSTVSGGSLRYNKQNQSGYQYTTFSSSNSSSGSSVSGTWRNMGANTATRHYNENYYYGVALYVRTA
jgi:hypothetical protein